MSYLLCRDFDQSFDLKVSGSRLFSAVCRVVSLDKKRYSTFFQGPKIWNSLPTDVTAVTSFYSFKRLKQDKQNLSTHT